MTRAHATSGGSLLATLAFVTFARVVLAEETLVHVVRPGETLASIAEQYYGDPRNESILVAENGLTSEGGSAIVVGLRLRIPTVSYHRVKEGETWATIASQYYGDPQRAFAVIEANGASPEAQPDPGAELVIPYPLRHVAAQHDTVRSIAKEYYRSLKTGTATIRRFNGVEGNRLQRGQIVLVPMAGLVLTDAARTAAHAASGEPNVEGKVRERQAQIDQELPALREHVRGGRYADAVQMANRLIGGGNLSARQIVTIERELGTALVALDRDDLATEAFARLLGQQPDYELDGVKTSPAILRVFERARQVATAARAAAAPKAAAPKVEKTAAPERATAEPAAAAEKREVAAPADSSEAKARPDTKPRRRR